VASQPNGPDPPLIQIFWLTRPLYLPVDAGALCPSSNAYTYANFTSRLMGLVDDNDTLPPTDAILGGE
jgi:hypothetical protein